MTPRWFTATEIAKATGQPVRVINRTAEKAGWRRNGELARKRKGRGGGFEYHIDLFPAEWRAGLIIQPEEPQAVPETSSNALWDRYEALTAKQKRVCETRLEAIRDVDTMMAGGCNETSAIAIVSRKRTISKNTLYNWRRLVDGVEPHDRLAALAPQWRGSTTKTAVCEEAWKAFKSDYLRAEAPAFSACYRRMVKAAEKQGWQPIPSERALRRRLDAEVPAEVLVMARKGREKAKTLYPAQKRTRSHLHAMQAVNMDGHKLDLFVRMEDGRVTRVQLIALQDLYSNKFVAWRLAETENKDVVRLVIGDMVENFGIPERIYLDNGRAFASKQISGGAKNRYRFSIKKGEPLGLLTVLGVEITFTNPYSGQSKPIERAFRDLTEEIARHPSCAGAYTGNRPDAKPENYGKSAVPIAFLREHVTQQIQEHNQRPGRRTETANGRSFEETFMASMEDPSTIVRWPTSAQKSLWLLAAENIRAQRGSGAIEYLGNRYWSQALNAYAGQKLTIRFDPDDLKAGIKVYDLEERFVCDAACIEAVGFDNTDAARETARNRRNYLKATKEAERLEVAMTPNELADIYRPEKKPAAPGPVRPAVTRLATAVLSKPDEELEEWDETSEQGFGNFVRLVSSQTMNE